MDTDFSVRLADYRALRHEVEENVLPLATSVDGRRFSFQSPLRALELRLGGYVVIEVEGTERLGQIEALEVAQADAGEISWSGAASLSSKVLFRAAKGEGALLDGDGPPFHDATIRPGTPAEVGAWLTRSAKARARLDVGDLRLSPGVRLGLDAGGFDRHTFLCGQSGSGKTYALGVLLERLLLETTLEIVVLDPNSDFVRLGELRPDVDDPALAERYRAAAAGVVVHSARGPNRLRLRLAELERAQQAAALRLDPLADRDEYAELVELLEAGTPEAFQELDRDGLARRARNLGVDSWGVWARGDSGSTLDALDSARCLVVDLGSLSTPSEQALVAGAVLGRLWAQRERRRPRLIVIDEAHNVCPARPEGELTALATELAVRIAAEGRKFGLYLLTSTQRPQKVHENIVTQSDNLVLMRLNSAADLAYAREAFSFAPSGLIGLAGSFRLGEALVAGKLAPHPALAKIGPRIAQEGGADVPADWA